MKAPKLAAVLVALAMLMGFGYISWTSRQAAKAQSQNTAAGATRTQRIEKAIEQAELEMNGQEH